MRAKKSLGQHFLTSPHVVSKIIEASDIKKSEDFRDKVLEIGPGTGILTQKLLEAGAQVLACEKDDRAIPILQQKFAKFIDDGSLELIHGDILTLDISKYGLKEGNYKIVANIPYYITGEILERFLEKTASPSSMVLMVQKEVADRIMARDDKQSILSLSIKMFGKPSYICHVSRGSFNPPPTVDSAVIKIDDISQEFFKSSNISSAAAFAIIKSGFAHKRKLLIRNLESIYGDEHGKKISVRKM
jgi:16S rRNA (adenine1518-N6/adenine1519-N6)-dimethyltransferase